MGAGEDSSEAPGPDAASDLVLKPMPACSVASGNVLALQGKPKNALILSVTYATAETVQLGGETAEGQWSLSVSTDKMKRALAPGSYDDAQRFGAETSGHSGFAFSGGGVPSSCDENRFRIEAINVVEPDLKLFTIDFWYSCGGSADRGCFRYDPVER